MTKKQIFQQKGHCIAIILISLIFSFLFSSAREYRILSHFIFSCPNFIEYFGYASKAFLLSLPFFFIAFFVLYQLIRVFVKGGYKRKILISVIVIAILLSPFYSNPGVVLNHIIPPIQPNLNNDKTYVVFTFDTEEDYIRGLGYYDSYKYITSGAFYQLAEGLAARNISATFYVTPNLARDIPEVLDYLEEKNQSIGVHLHPHTLLNISYPYKPPFEETKGDDIAAYDFAEKKRLMKLAKGEVEAAVGHKTLLYRSGKLSCDCEIEEIAKDLDYEAISNHKGIYYIEPIGIWNFDVGEEDLLDFSKFDELPEYIEHFEKRAKKQRIVIFSAHPMSLYDHTLDKTREKELNIFFEFVDYLKNEKNVEFINQHQLLLMTQNYKER